MTSPRQQWQAHPGLGRAYGAVAVFAAFLGLTLLLGDESRLSAAAFTTIREVGGPLTWGLALVGGALALAVAPLLGPRLVQGALLVGALVHGLLAAWFLSAAWSDPLASYWGAGVFVLIAYWHVSQTMEYGA
jgi:hypothetical protein